MIGDYGPFSMPRITYVRLTARYCWKEVDLRVVVVDLVEEALSGGLFSDYGGDSRFQVSVLQ